MSDVIAAAIRATLISPNEADRNLEPANIVDGLFAIARAITSVSQSIDNATEELAALADVHSRLADTNEHVADAISGLGSELLGIGQEIGWGLDPDDKRTNHL